VGVLDLLGPPTGEAADAQHLTYSTILKLSTFFKIESFLFAIVNDWISKGCAVDSPPFEGVRGAVEKNYRMHKSVTQQKLSNGAKLSTNRIKQIESG
jgi:hypothetical protein